jgi:hypothetical protein
LDYSSENNKAWKQKDPSLGKTKENIFQYNEAEQVNSFKERTRQHYEITNKAKETYIDSLKKKAELNFNEFNRLKGGPKQIQGLANSADQNFQYQVFSNETFKEQYTGISKLVRERLNDP